MVGRMGCRGSVGCAAGLGLTVGGRGKAREFFEIFPEVRLAAERQDVGYLPYGIRTGAEQTPGMENGESLYPFAGRCPGGHGYHPAEMLPADGEFVGIEIQAPVLTAVVPHQREEFGRDLLISGLCTG